MKQSDLETQYRGRHGTLAQFARRIESLCRDLLDQKHISFHAIEVRAKSVESFLEKAARPGKSYSDPLQQITDQVGARIIIYYPSDVDEVCSLLRGQFIVDEASSVDKRSELAADQFGYSSVHLLCQLSASRSDLVEWSMFTSILFEVQVRTVLQHAWASISHALEYKQEADVPPQFKRRLNRLAGLLELADAEFLSLKEQRSAASTASEENIKRHELDFDIDIISLGQYLKTSVPVKRIRKITKDAGFRIEGTLDSTQVLAVSVILGFGTVQKLDESLQELIPFAEAFFPAFWKETSPGTEFVAGDSGHWTAVALAGRHYKTLTAKALEQAGLWSADYRREVRAAARLTQSCGTGNA